MSKLANTSQEFPEGAYTTAPLRALRLRLRAGLRAPQAAFTLIELMIILGIIGILSFIVAPFYQKYTQSTRRSTCIANMKKIDEAIALAKTLGIANPTVDDLVGARGHFTVMPACPSTKEPYRQFDPPVCPSGDATHFMPPEA